MAFHHRKLLNDSLSVICARPCDPIWNPNGNCFEPCLSYCPSVCKSSIIPYPPPPPPSLPPPVPSPPDLDKPRQLSHILIASLAVLATAFFLFTCYTIYKFYTVWRSSSRRRRQPSQRRHPEEDDDNDDFLDEDHGPVVDHPIWYIRTIGLQPSVINAITIVNYKKADGLVEGTDCAVCLSEFQEDETLRLLPKCNHAFHIPCIDTWLGSHTNCPMCRAGIVSTAAGSPPSQEPAALEEEARSESIRVGIEDERSQSGVEMSEDVEGGDCKVDLGGLEGLQPVRRSVSMDSVSALMISAAVANAFPQQCERNSGKAKEIRVGGNENLLRLVGSPVMERCMQTGSSSIKRSASCSAKVFLSRHSSRR